ncbi:hypothetical protein F4861DRAFT_275342 [Xylaria intraflava]|nr:hypothetical protein F4861DRAFT_275342 [Xylaria intraflava]
MSSYDPYDYDAPPREHHHHHHHSSRYYYDDRRERERGEPRYAESLDSFKRPYPNRNALIPREESEHSVEEVSRDFPPPGYSQDLRRAPAEPIADDDYYYYSRRSRDKTPSRGTKSSSVYYEEERTRKRVLSKQEKILAAVAGGLIAAGAKEVWDRREASKEGTDVHRNIAASAAIGAAGAFATYQGADFYNKHQTKEDRKSTRIVHKGRDGRTVEYYSDEEEDPRSHKGNKSFLENALSAAGLGSAISALTGGESERDSHHRSKSRRGSVDSHRSHDNASARMQKAAKASLIAGAAEAFRVAKEPGGWKGEKMKRVITAAAGAATIDAALDPTKSSKRHLVESVIGGLVGNRMLNGSRKDIEEDRSTGRSRSRSRARSGSRGHGPGLAALATAGLGALGAKKLVDSRSRSRSRARSYDSRGDRDSSPPKRRSRSRSIVDTARRSLAKIGLGNESDDERRDSRYHDDYSPRRGSRRGNDRYDDDDYYMKGGRGPPDDYYDDRSRRGHSRSPSHSRGRSKSVSSSDLGDSDTDKKTTSKMRRKQAITTGLATVATIHAAHSVYQSVEAARERHKAVQQGKLSPEKSQKLKRRAIVEDAAAVGLAALGIKGAIGEVKEAREQAKSITEWKVEREKRHQKRIERLKRANDDHYGRSRADGWATSSAPRERRFDDGPRYADGNPYSDAITPPPIGHDRQ